MNLMDLASSACVPMTMSTCAVGECRARQRRILRIDEARELSHLERETLESLGESAEMLARQQRRRHDDGDLLAAHGHDEGGAQRDFGLAEADIAADEAIHRPPAGQVFDRVGDGVFLVLGLLIGKPRAEFVIEALRRIDRRERTQFARRRDADEFGGDLAHALLHARLALLPACPAQAIELRRAFVGAVARQEFDILDGQEQLAAVILDLEAVMRRAERIDRVQAHIAADAMLDMRDEIARREARGFAQEILRAFRFRRAGAPCGRPGCPARRRWRNPALRSPVSSAKHADAHARLRAA